MSDAERVMAVLDSLSIEALEVMGELGSEPDAEPVDVFTATLKTFFDLGVEVGLSDIGPRVLAALRVVSDTASTDGVDEFRAAFAAPEIVQ